MIIGIICAIIAGGFVFLFSGLISMIFLSTDIITSYLRIFAIDLVTMTFAYFPQQAMLGARKYKIVSLVIIIQNIIRFSLAILLFIIGLNISGIIIGWIIGDSIGVLISVIMAIRVFSGECNCINLPKSQMVRFSGGLLAMNISGYFLQSIDRYAVLILIGSYSLGLYSPAATAASMVEIVPLMITSALFPHYAGLSASSTSNHLQKSEQLVSRWIFILFIPTAFGLASIALPLITIIGGERYTISAGALMICSIAIGITCASASINAKFLAEGHVSPLIIANVFAIVIGVVASFFLIPLLGLIGAALMRFIMLIVLLSITSFILKSKGKLNLDWKMLIHGLIGSTVMFLTVIYIQLVFYSIVFLPIYIFVGILIYAIYMIFAKMLFCISQCAEIYQNIYSVMFIIILKNNFLDLNRLMKGVVVFLI